jgi:hypothetical protein
MLYALITIACVYLGKSNHLRQYSIWFIVAFVAICIIVALIFRVSNKLQTWLNEQEPSEVITNWDIQDEIMYDIDRFSNRTLVSNIIGLLGMLVVPTAILTGIAILHYMDKITISASPTVIGITVFCYFVYCFYVSRGMFYEKQRRLNINNESDAPMAKGTQKLLDSITELENLSIKLKKEAEEVRKLQVPIPNIDMNVSNAPLADYVKALYDTGKHHPELCSLEQFILYITKSISIDDWKSSIADTLKATGDVVAASGHLTENFLSNIFSYIAHPDKDATTKLVDNTLQHLSESGHSTIFRYKLIHAKGWENKIITIGKEVGKDTGKGAVDTFVDPNDIQNIHDSIGDLYDSLNDFCDQFISNLTFDIPDTFEPDFDFESHFPIITTVKEGITNILRACDGDVDMETSIMHSLTKIGLRGSGATLGAVIGSCCCPFFGSVIGSMVGSWIGGWAANEFNTQTLKELKGQLKIENDKLQSMSKRVQEDIITQQQTMVIELNKVAIDEQSILDKAKKDAPIEIFDIRSLLYVYNIVTVDFLWSLAEHYSIESYNYNEAIYNRILSIIPTSTTLHNRQKEALKTMWNGIYALYRDGITFDKYQKPSNYTKIFHTAATDIAAALELSNLLWANKVRLVYADCVNMVIKSSEEEFSKLEKFISKRRTEINQQIRICEDLANQANREAKTL